MQITEGQIKEIKRTLKKMEGLTIGKSDDEIGLSFSLDENGQVLIDIDVLVVE